MQNARVLSAATLEPWLGNIIDLTMFDGTHRIGLLRRVDDQVAMLEAGRGNPPIVDGGKVQISDAVSLVRASIN